MKSIDPYSMQILVQDYDSVKLREIIVHHRTSYVVMTCTNLADVDRPLPEAISEALNSTIGSE